MWFTGGYGIEEFDGTSWRRMKTAEAEDISCADATIDSRGTIWVATRSQGLMRLQDSRWTRFTTRDGLLSNEVESVHADASDRLWVSTRDGLCGFDGQRFYKINVPETWGHFRLDSDGYGGLWFDNAIRVIPDHDAPRVLAEIKTHELNYDGRAYVTWTGFDRWNRTPSEQLNYSWRIDDGPWSAFTHKNSVVVEGLSSGSHSLRIRVRDDRGNVSPASERVSLTVIAPYYRRPGFVISALCLVGILFWQALRLYRRGRDLRESNRALENARAKLSQRVENQMVQFRALCDCSPIGIYATNPAGEVTYFNEYLMNFLQRSQGPLESIYRWMENVHPDDLPAVHQAWESALRNETEFRSTGRVVRPDGSVRWFETAANRMERDDVFLGYVGAVDDVTETRLATEQLQQTNVRLESTMDQLQAAQEQAIRQERLKALGQMAAGVAHDINNTLTPLMNYSELLAMENQLSPAGREWTSLIRMGVSDTAETVRRLDHFYRESHNDEFLAIIDLAEIVLQTIELTRPRWQDECQSERRQIRVSSDIKARPTIRGDASQLRSVLTNLIFNAIDAIQGHGEIIVAVNEQEGMAGVSVTDTGIGMNAEQLRHCLEPFYTSKLDGSGLGLSECHGIVRQHGGQLNITSQEGAGTTVGFQLPAQTETREAAEPIGTGDNRMAETDSGLSEKVTVLCIDDNDVVRRSTAALLNILGAEVLMAEDGPAGLAIIEEASPQLVLCDQGLPGMDGLEVLRCIRERWPHIPVVMVSGWSLPEFEDGHRPDAFVEKPFTLDRLKSVLAEFTPLQTQ